MDTDGYLYVLDVDKLQTEKYEGFYKKVADLHRDWGFKERWVETNNGGKLIKQYLHDHIRKQRGTPTLDSAVASNEPNTEERTLQIPDPLYRHGEV